MKFISCFFFFLLVFIEVSCLEFYPTESYHEGLQAGFSKSFRHPAGDPSAWTTIFISLQVFDSWALSKEEIRIAEYHLAPVNLSNEC